MAIWDKATYYANYSICPRGVYKYPDGHTESRRFTEIRLHYHPRVIKPITKTRVDELFKKYSFTATDKVVVFGAGFGWLCEELESRIGCSTIGIDPSTYVVDNKDLSPDDELLESIIAAGLNITEDPGKQIWEQFSQPGVARTTANIQDLDLTTSKDRNALGRDFGIPTHIITEEVWQLFTPQEQTDFTTAFGKVGGTLIHIIDGVII